MYFHVHTWYRIWEDLFAAGGEPLFSVLQRPPTEKCLRSVAWKWVISGDQLRRLAACFLQIIWTLLRLQEIRKSCFHIAWPLQFTNSWRETRIMKTREKDEVLNEDTQSDGCSRMDEFFWYEARHSEGMYIHYFYIKHLLRLSVLLWPCVCASPSSSSYSGKCMFSDYWAELPVSQTPQLSRVHSLHCPGGYGPGDIMQCFNTAAERSKILLALILTFPQKVIFCLRKICSF